MVKEAAVWEWSRALRDLCTCQNPQNGLKEGTGKDADY